MTPQEIAEKIKAEIDQGSAISLVNLIQLKKYFDELKNNQNNTASKPGQLFQFKEKIIGYLLTSLTRGQLPPKDKSLILEILERDLISTKYNVQLFNKLYNYLIEQDENIAIQASKAIDALIKQINEGQQYTQGAMPLDTKLHYIKLFEFLKDKTQFLLKLSQHTKDPDFKVYRRQAFEEKNEKDKEKERSDRDRDRDKERDRREIVFKNSKSLKFINQVPHLFIHLMAYVDINNRSPEDDNRIKELIKKSIDNIVQSLRKTPYEEFYNEFNYDFNNELFGVMTKLLQFLFINLRSDKEQSGTGHKSNMNLKKHIADQIEFIRVPEVIKNFIHLLKNCSEDFQLNRYEIVNRLKLLLNNLDKNKLSKADSIDIMNDILNQDTIFGKKKILGDYSKNAICSYWIEMIRSPVLINNIFPLSIISLRSVAQSNLAEDNPEINACFLNIQKLVEEVLKTIFDNAFYPSVQQKCIELITYLIDQLFPDGIDQTDNITLFTNCPAAKKIQENKLKVLLRILDCAALKFMSIRHIFEEIDQYVTKKFGRKITKKDLPEPLKLQHMQLSTLHISPSETPDWNTEVINFIEGREEQIDASLLTVTVVQNKFLTIYQEEDELCFNSHPVKINNYTLYMREVKTKLLQKCITLSHKITKTFLSQNIEMYNPVEVSSLKAIYFILSNKKSLTSDQCKILSTILKNGLKIFEILHNYDLHSDDQTNKKGHLKNFMLIFAQIYDPVNFRDIFEPNMDNFFRNLITYAKNCADYCLQFVLIEPYCSNNNQTQPFNKNIVELLTYNLILRLQSTSDQLDPFHEFYDYKQEYFLLLQKLIRFPFRCLSRYSDESFIRNYFRQIILFLTKKAHTSRFCLDYLHLMRTLFKNILFNSNREAASPLFSQFYAICCKNSQASQAQNNTHSVFVNVNILDNFMKFFDTGIPELADIVTELVIMLPLKSKHIIQFAKQGYIVKPLLHCLCLMSDYNYLLRTLKTFQIIISHSTAEEISQFLEGVKDKLINRLFEMVVSQYKSSDLKPDKINNDLSSLSLKLLAKLGALSRNRDIPLQIEDKNQKKMLAPEDFEIIFEDLQTNKKLKSSMILSIEYAIEIFHKLLDSYYQSIIFISMEMIEKSFQLLLAVLPLSLTKMHPLSEKIINVFTSILSLSSKYLTISPSILTKIREDVKNQIKTHCEHIKNQLKNYGLTEYSKFFIRVLVMNLNERVLITREQNFIKQISQEPKRFLWGLLTNIIEFLEGSEAYLDTYTFIVKLLISSAVMINSPQQIKLNNYQNDYNHSLPYKNAALAAINQILDQLPFQIFEQMYPDILEAVFISVVSIPDILNLKIMKHPKTIARKIYKFILKDQQQFLKNFSSQKTERVFTCILQNLVSYSLECHDIAMEFINMIMNETKLNLHQLLYGNTSWNEICDNCSIQTKNQSRFSLNDFSNWKQNKKYPILPLVRNLIKIVHNVNEDTLKNNSKNLKMFKNCFATFEMLISIKCDGKIFQAFQILSKQKEGEEFAEDNVIFHQTFKKIIAIAQSIIEINSKVYENFTKIIIEQPNAPTVPQGSNLNQPPRPNITIPPPGPRAADLNRGREQPPPNQQSLSGNNSFNINTNTFIDDDQYGLNIEDLDVEVKTWGNLIASILKFLKSILINDIIFNVSKSMLKKKIEKSKLIEIRLEIIFVMFELIGRVDKNVRQTAYQCLKELLAREEHPKDLIQNDEKLKHILRPVLISLQLQFKKFTPSFLHMFRKILKLLTQCFNITLIQKLVDKLRQMEKNKQSEANNQGKAITPAQQVVKHLNYSEITLETKCIANFLGLFQHLAYAYHNHKSANYTVNSIILIFKYVGNISNYYSPKLGKHTIKIYIKKTLAKVLNTMCEKLSGESIFVDVGAERELDIENFLELLKLQDSFPLREKLTRQTTYIDKALAEYSKNKAKKEYIIFLEIIYVFAKHNSKWMREFKNLSEKLCKELNDVIQAKFNSKYEERKDFELNEKSEIILLCKNLLEFVKQNPQDLNALFCLVNVFKLRSTLNLHFLRKYFKYELYYQTTAETKKRIFVDFLNHLKNPIDADKIIAISQNIIYHFVLIQVNVPKEERQILTGDDDELLKNLTETIKFCLNPRNLHNKGYSPNNSKQSANNYRIAIELLQISNLSLSALKDIQLHSNYQNNMLLTVWGLLRVEDKIIKNYAFVWTSNYIRMFQNFDTNKALGLYLTLIRALESLSQGDYQIGALIKKALNILIPYWDTKSKGSSSNSWIEWSLKAVHEQTNEPNKLVRFWEIVVKNHKIFHKFKQTKFETQMVNSMQWLMVANNPTSSNPLVKKIASDMSFIYIEWKFKEAKQKLLDAPTEEDKKKILEESINDKAAEICLNFFIKVALNNSNDKDDKEIMKRSLYLLKKTLILWPSTKKKFEAIKTIVNKLKSTSSASSSSSQNLQMPLRFHYTLLNIINILLIYESDDKIVSQLTSIFKLLQLGGQLQPPRFASSTHPPPAANSIFTMNNIYLLNLLCIIIRRLVKVAFDNPSEEESQRLLQEIHQYIRDGFEYHVISGNKGRINPPPTQNRNNQPMKKIQIEVAVSFLKILFDLEEKSVDIHLNYIKQVTASLKKMFEKGFETSSKNSSPSRVYELPPLTEGSFSEMLVKDLEINVELIKPENLATAEENYEKDSIKSYATRRPLFVILLRILASKFNQIHHVEQQSNILDIFLSIYQKIPDPELKIEVICILKCMFIGEKAFNHKVPERYKFIKPINYSIKKIFHLLFEDNNKFNQHFEKRKSKPSDQNYNINERIYEEITTKYYFNFLCQFIIHLEELPHAFLEKIKVFILYAIKVADPELVDQIFELLDKSYERNSVELYVNLFQDYRELHCAEENLQGDEIALFFTFFLYRKAIRLHSLSIRAFAQQVGINFHNHYLSFLKADIASPYHNKALFQTIKTSLNLLPTSKKLPKILKEYLMNGSYTEGWGAIVLKLALEKNCINPEELYSITSKINQWGLLIKYLQNNNSDAAKIILDYTYRAYGDKDLIYGYRISLAKSLDIQRSFVCLQQRKYTESLKHIQQYEISKSKRTEATKENQMHDDESDLDNIFQSLESLVNDSSIADISKECYKNLNKWDELDEKDSTDYFVKMDYLFHSNGDKSRILNVLGDLDKINHRQFPYYYGKSVINFMESNTSQNRQLNISLLYALLEWLSFPKNAKYNQNKMLVKIQCLLELEEGQKIKEQSLTGISSEHPSLVDALTKVVQSVYTQINSWRERMPDKNEDIWVWHAILGQRIMVYDFMKIKMISLLESVMKNQQNYGCNVTTSTERLLIPYTDIEWNKLKIIKQERNFEIFNQNNFMNSNNSNNLYLDEIFLKEKEKFYQMLIHKKDYSGALSHIEQNLNDFAKVHKDDELSKVQQIELFRLKAKVLMKNHLYKEANALYNHSLNNVEQHLLPLWRDWMVLCIKGYTQTKKIEWAQSALSIIPYALRYKMNKTKFIIAPLLQIMSDFSNNKDVKETLETIADYLPIKPFVFWLPQLIRLAERSQTNLLADHIYKILQKLSIYYPQTLYYFVRPFCKSNYKSAQNISIAMKKAFYNLMTKLESCTQLLIELRKEETISILKIGALSRCFSELHVPLYQNYRGDLEPSLIPTIAQISQNVETEIVNGKQQFVITILASDGRQYKFSLQQPTKIQKCDNLTKEYEKLLASQTFELVNNHLSIWRESSIRKLKLLEARELYLSTDTDQMKIMKSSSYTVTPQDILNDFMSTKTAFDSSYPQSDKSFLKLPKSQINKSMNKRMKEIVSENLLKDYLMRKASSFDDFICFRKVFAYQYGVVAAFNYIFSIDTTISNFMINLKTGYIHLLAVHINPKPVKLSAFAVRLTRNFMALFGKTHLNAGVMPAFLATIESLCNQKLNFHAFVDLLFSELQKVKQVEKAPIFQRIEELHQNTDKARKILEVAQKLGQFNDVPYQLKYWF